MAASMIKKLLKPEIPTIYKNFFTNTNYIQKAFLQKLKKNMWTEIITRIYGSKLYTYMD